jgi:DMSO reductase iron-sulfur subunit
MRCSFVFDANTCTGCQACQLACVIENDLEPESGWRQVHTFNERRLPGIPLFHLSLACNHCAEPACLEACPALVYSRDTATGAVLIDRDRCIGCRYCSWACPYDAPRFDAARGVMTKCTFCNDRIHAGLQPACVDLCPTTALRFDRLSEPEITNDVEGFPRSDLRPAIRIVPLREHRQEPEPSAAPEMPFRIEPHAAIRPKVSLRSEWSLVVFTLLGAVLFALATAAVAGGPEIHPLTFAATAAAGMALGSAHLGRKKRAWRAVLGVARSWLSREIVCFSVFAAVGTAYLIWMPDNRVSGGITLLLGVATLFSMDRVYDFAKHGAFRPPHSAGVLLTGLFLAGVWTASVRTIVILGAAKLLFYVARKVRGLGRGRSVRLEVSALRVGCGLVLPVVLWASDAPLAQVLAPLTALAGELIDRCEFYAGLEFPTPAQQMAIDLQTRGGPGPGQTMHYQIHRHECNSA